MSFRKISRQDRDMAVRLCDEGGLPEHVHDLFVYIALAWSWGKPVEEGFYRGFKKFVSQYRVTKKS